MILSWLSRAGPIITREIAGLGSLGGTSPPRQTQLVGKCQPLWPCPVHEGGKSRGKPSRRGAKEGLPHQATRDLSCLGENSRDLIGVTEVVSSIVRLVLVPTRHYV